MSASESGNTIDIVIPDIGDFDTVEVIEILVAVGDQVAEDDGLITLESDKASMEVPSPTAGTIQSLSVAIGDQLGEGKIIGTMSASNTESASTMPSGTADEPPGADTDPGAAPEAAAKNTSDNTTASPANSDVLEAKVSDIGNPDGGEANSSNTSESRSKQARSTSPTAHIDDSKIRKAHASPGVRRYAREHGANLALMQGTGPKGRILKPDVIAFIKQSMEDLSTGSSAVGAVGLQGGMGIPPIPQVDFTKFGEVERVELSRINKLSAANLHRAWLNVPMVTHHDQADVTELEAFRQQLKKQWKEGQPKITGLAFHMKALVAGLKAFPRFNSSLAPDGQSLFYKKYFHIGIAVDTPNGLVVPVFKDVDKKGINELAEEMADMSSRARNKKLKPGEMQGASMTISSLGGIGGSAFTPIVNPPEVAILGITRATMQPVWNGSEFQPRLMCPLDISYDHRVIDGAEAARFMAFYVNTVADIRRLLL